MLMLPDVKIYTFWEYLSYGHQLVGNDDSCNNGLAYMKASQEPGKFHLQNVKK